MLQTCLKCEMFFAASQELSKVHTGKNQYETADLHRQTSVLCHCYKNDKTVSMLTDKSHDKRLKNGLHFMQYLSK